MALPHDKRDAGGRGDDDQANHHGSLVRYGREVDGQDDAAHEHDGQEPPRLSTGSDVSLTCEGMNFIAHSNATTANGSVIRKTDPPVQVFEECSRDEGAE